MDNFFFCFKGPVFFLVNVTCTVLLFIRQTKTAVGKFIRVVLLMIAALNTLLLINLEQGAPKNWLHVHLDSLMK